MNETEVAVSRGTTRERQPLPLFCFNRRFVICCALFAATLQLALAETSPDRTRPVRTPAVPASVKLVKSPLKPVITRDTGSLDWRMGQIIKSRRVNDASHRRDRFEAEFGIEGKKRAGVMGSLQLAKYTLDDVTFTVDDFTRSLSDALKLEYDHGHVHRAVSANDKAHSTVPGPWSDLPQGLRFGPEFDLTGGKPYVGLVVVIPFGD